MGDKSSTGNGCLTWDQQAGEWGQWLSDVMSQPREDPDAQTITDTYRAITAELTGKDGSDE